MKLTDDMEQRAQRVADERGRGTKGALSNDDIHDMLAAAVAPDPEDNCIDYDAAVKAVGEALAEVADSEPSTYWYNRARRILWPLLNEFQQAAKVMR